MYFKGMVMEVKEAYALVMKEDGTITRILNKPGLKMGQKIFFTEEDIVESSSINQKDKNPKKHIMAFIAAAAAVILMMIPLLKGVIPMDKGYAMITFDINPSLSIKIDKNQTIVKAEGLNDDGKALDLEALKGKTLAEGSGILRNTILNKPEITNKDSVIVGFTFLNSKEDVEFEDKIKGVLNNNFKNFKVMYLKGNKEDLKMAEEKGISLGKYEAILRLDDDALEEKLEELSVPELMDLLKKHSNTPYLSEEIKEEIQDEIEDKIEDSNNKGDNSDDKDDDDSEDKGNKDDDDEDENDESEQDD